MQLRVFLARLVPVALGLVGVSAPASAQVTPYGSGINPPGSLELIAGSPQIGASFQLSVRNTAVANPPPGQAFLSISTQPAPGFPGGIALPGTGLAFPGATGELLIDLVAPNPFLTLGPATYLGGGAPGASFSLAVPLRPGLIGLDLYAQGLLVTPSQGFAQGFTNGLQFELGAPLFPGLVLIPPGTFQMGSAAGPAAPYFGQPNESPVHAVTHSRVFWMGATEVTQAQYQALMGTNPSFQVGPNRPVERVTWFDAQAYCAALTAQQAALGMVPADYHYRLPTEAEWEYACRAGTTSEFNLGASLACDQARFLFSHHSGSFCSLSAADTSVAVGSFAPNSWGLFDLHGNVLEWCLDSSAPYTASEKTDPFVTGGPTRILRGGSWFDDSADCRSAYRNVFNPSSATSSIGFRVVLAPILVP